MMRSKDDFNWLSLLIYRIYTLTFLKKNSDSFVQQINARKMLIQMINFRTRQSQWSTGAQINAIFLDQMFSLILLNNFYTATPGHKYMFNFVLASNGRQEDLKSIASLAKMLLMLEKNVFLFDFLFFFLNFCCNEQTPGRKPVLLN